MVEFATRLTMAKRRILEDPELYKDDQCSNRVCTIGTVLNKDPVS